MKIVLALIILILAGCTQVKPVKINGYVVPKSCGNSWVCPGEPECADEHLKFLCEPWNKDYK
jgi:hypothetical protein